MKKLRVGTRKSPLAMRQTQIVIDLLKAVAPEIECEVVGLSTKGDRLQKADLTKIGGKGVFVKEVEYQLQQGLIDFAVHSLKDMPAKLPSDLLLAATPQRALALDCLILKEEVDLNRPLTIGTSSIRRAKQLANQFPQMRFVPIRGKIETRLKKMVTENLDGTVLACAGLERMNYFDILDEYQILAPEICVPAVGQGILGIECCKNDNELCQLLSKINHLETYQAALAERYLLEQMDGNCDVPIGAYAKKLADGEWCFYGFLAENRESDGEKVVLTGSDPLSLAKKAMKKLSY
ncbi:hydroxymethylbilane synthase [Enterococcus alishanensis]|uniref:Hydroxymethylbilane synthase n=1 Tax=Enterococcus alishanensis TaxID=1303817 RepID=A0ABS6TAY4_9ENTE|nr:hydroxymethylbilane synthase [Enterococcus alishanensis]MBV7390045.1 hydroxymethylbilane synthase [Enterococcus alishanensis]